ncbi:MAG: ABC transporter substrate-binding protein [Candidimonas sp.]|jgi:peptide/nickel transport system substrate-binding protein
MAIGTYLGRMKLVAAATAVAFYGLSVAPSAVAATPQKGGTLNISFPGSPRLLDPAITGSLEEWVVTSWLYNNLTRMNSKYEIEPDLAESWEASESGKVWTFKLRQGVKFQSGGELTADDVVFSIKRILDPEVKSRGRGAIGPIENVEAVDQHTVRFTLSRPIAEFPANMTLPYARIIRKDTDVKLDTASDGTGPFILKEYVVGDRVVVIRNPDYFRENEPYVDEVRVQVYPDATAEINALKAGQTHIMWQVRPDQVSLLDGDSAIKVEEIPSGSFVTVVMRSDEPPFDNPLVRKALKLSVDRETIVKAALQGHGAIANDQSLPPNSPLFNDKALPAKRDIAKAKSLLKEAGYPNGLDLTLFTSDARVGMLPLALMTQQMAREAGFNIKLQTVTWDVFLNQVWEKKNFYVQNWFARPTNDSRISPYFLSRDKGGSLNDYYYSNPELDELLLQAQGELDQEKRKNLYHEAQRIISEDGPGIIPFFKNNISAYRTNVAGFSVDPGINLSAEQVWLKKD